MLKQVTIAVLIGGLFAFMPALCVAKADQATLNQMTETVNSFCLSGDRFHFDASVDGQVSFLKKGGKGGVEFNVFKQKGAAAYLNEAIRKLADEGIRQCTEKQLPRILDYIEHGGAADAGSSTINQSTGGDNSAATIEKVNLDGKNVDQSTKGNNSPAVISGSQ